MISIAIKQFAGVKFYYCVMLVDIFGMLEKTCTQYFFIFLIWWAIKVVNFHEAHGKIQSKKTIISL